MVLCSVLYDLNVTLLHVLNVNVVEMLAGSLEEDYEDCVKPVREELSEKQQHQLKHRELFLSRQVETLPATHIRGKCAVTLLNETESLLSYLNRDVSMKCSTGRVAAVQYRISCFICTLFHDQLADVRIKHASVINVMDGKSVCFYRAPCGLRGRK